MEFRPLKAEEIECRVGMAKEKGFSLLLYKDARCDMAILDEAVTPMMWKREHSRDNANCTVSIYSKELGQWVGKEDTGSESNTEKQKGLASDSFKRACVNWGIGRELYTSPFIWISDAKYIKVKEWQGKKQFKVHEKFKPYHLVTANGKIKELGIMDSKGVKVFRFIEKGVSNG